MDRIMNNRQFVYFPGSVVRNSQGVFWHSASPARSFGGYLLNYLRRLKNSITRRRWQSHPFGKSRVSFILNFSCALATLRGTNFVDFSELSIADRKSVV